ncbi:MAG: A/G-specific adenine glycosylase [Spirochaetaceae bacterium]|jgi:A/G-specific adenine glycosylase|nr:A/G-specific adenine glycosylase [Spirochaetaceae bacterium]
MQLSTRQILEFRKIILGHYEDSGRSFPWRYTEKTLPSLPEQKAAERRGAWGVLVSEYMLQQTQTQRVVPYWERWMRLWPRPEDLATASLEGVLREWSGLGYNRRAKMLLECAKIIVEKHRGKVPATPEELITLPGIGPYSSGAIACFAWNYPAVFIETNIRSVMLHFFFQDQGRVGDRELFPLLAQTLDRSNPRVWYWALMDYGAELKKLAENPGRRSAHYVRQNPFQGSLRQIRGAVIKALSEGGRQDAAGLKEKIAGSLKTLAEEDYCKALKALEKELLVAEEGGLYRIR